MKFISHLSFKKHLATLLTFTFLLILQSKIVNAQCMTCNNPTNVPNDVSLWTKTGDDPSQFQYNGAFPNPTYPYPIEFRADPDFTYNGEKRLDPISLLDLSTLTPTSTSYTTSPFNYNLHGVISGPTNIPPQTIQDLETVFYAGSIYIPTGLDVLGVGSPITGASYLTISTIGINNNVASPNEFMSQIQLIANDLGATPELVFTTTVNPGNAPDDVQSMDPLQPVISDNWNQLAAVLSERTVTYYLNGLFQYTVNLEFENGYTFDEIYKLFLHYYHQNSTYDGGAEWSETSVGYPIVKNHLKFASNFDDPNLSSPRRDILILPNPDNPELSGTLANFDLDSPNTTINGFVHNYGIVIPTGNLDFGHLTFQTGYRGYPNSLIQFYTQVGGTGSPTDTLTINGPVLGRTAVRVYNVNGQGAATGTGPGHGIMLIDASQGATNANNFYLEDGYITVGGYKYTLNLESDMRWYLQSMGPSAATSLQRSVLPLLNTYGLSILENDTLHRRNGGKMNAPRGTFCHEGDKDRCAWGRVIFIEGAEKQNNYVAKGADYNYSFKAVQAGSDVYHKVHKNGIKDNMGFFVASGNASADVKDQNYNFAGTSSFDSYSLGAYWTRYGASEWYLDGVIKASKFDRVSATSIDDDYYKTKGYGISSSLEAGYPIKINKEWIFEPQAQITHTFLSVDDTTDYFSNIYFKDSNSYSGRIGTRIARIWDKSPYSKNDERLSVWLSLDIIKLFRAKYHTSISSNIGAGQKNIFISDLNGTTGRIGLGIKSQLDNIVSINSTADYSKSFRGDSYSFAWKMGAQIKF